jgi:hypothetical protein
MVHGGNLLRSDNCGFATYECRTVYDVELADNQWKRAEQSMACQFRENQLLTKQRDEARERIKRLEESRTVVAANSLANMISYEDAIMKIKRLEEAGDAVEERLGCGCGCGGPCKVCQSASENWFKAKEIK